MKKLKTINIKGKEYVEVHERLRHFRIHYADHSLTSEVIEKTEDTILILATIKDSTGRALANVENAETSAWGRCLGNFGIGIDTAVASYDEVSNAITQQATKPTPQAKPKTPILHTLDIGDDNWDKVLKFVGDNKEKGLTYIVGQLKRKYKIKTEVKKEISQTIKPKK